MSRLALPLAAALLLASVLPVGAHAARSACLSFTGNDGVSENFCPEARGCIGFTYYVADRDGTSRGQTWGVVCEGGLVCTYAWDDFDGERSGGCLLPIPA